MGEEDFSRKGAKDAKFQNWKKINHPLRVLRALRGEFFSGLDRRPEVASHIPDGDPRDVPDLQESECHG
jgi:hypothetical protein